MASSRCHSDVLNTEMLCVSSVYDEGIIFLADRLQICPADAVM